MKKLIVCGVSRSGKSTYVKQLMKVFIDDVFVDVLEYVKAVIKRKKMKIGDDIGPELQTAYSDMIVDLYNGRPWSILEIAPDNLEVNIPAISKVLKKSGHKARMLFLDIPEHICLARNKKTKRKVPERVIKAQSKYSVEKVRKLCKENGIEFRRINTTLVGEK